MSQVFHPFISDMTESSLLMHFNFQMCFLIWMLPNILLPPQELCHCGYLVVTWCKSSLSVTGFSLSFVIYGPCEHYKDYFGKIQAIFLGDFNAQPVMKPWADRDIEWGHSNSGHFVLN